MGPKQRYREKLLDPRWQKKRLQILERDEWTCQSCKGTENTLHIHHRVYRGDDPWDAPDWALVTLCADCHELETMERAQVEALLLTMFRRAYLVDELLELGSRIADETRAKEAAKDI